MTDDIEERAALARRGIMDHSDCEDCVEDWTFLMRQGRREFPLGLRTVLACLAFAEREGAVDLDPVPHAECAAQRGQLALVRSQQEAGCGNAFEEVVVEQMERVGVDYRRKTAL